jgi:hypothetical protein
MNAAISSGLSAFAYTDKKRSSRWPNGSLANSASPRFFENQTLIGTPAPNNLLSGNIAALNILAIVCSSLTAQAT